MSKFTLLISFALFFSTAFSQNKSQTQPKLLIGIVVDQLRYDYLDKFSENFGSDGFNRLMDEGFYARNVNYNYKPTYTGPGHASIFTGTTPSMHGIVGNNWYSRAENKRVYCVELMDKDGEAYYAPERMKVQTIADQIRLYSNFKGKSYGISLKDRGAILPAGHLANGAYWFDGKAGEWVSSDFYEAKNSQWLKDFNSIDFYKKYLDKEWDLFAKESVYDISLNDSNSYEGELFPGSGVSFPYNLKEGFEKKGLSLLKSIPQGNSMTVDLALELLKETNLGQGAVLDFLSVSFSATDYVGHRYGVNSREVQDTYLRLDKDLARFMNYLDEEIGKENYLLFLTSDHGAGEVPSFLADRAAPGGYLEAKAIRKSVDDILDQTFGEADWVEYFINYNFYFNRDALKEKQLSLDEVLNVLTPELLTIEGIADVYHSNREVANVHLQQMISNGVFAAESGDLILLESPNYIIYSQTGSTHGSPYRYDTHVPLLYYGAGIQAGKTYRAYDIIDIVPTLSVLLNIPFPDGMSGQPMLEVVE